MSLKEQKLGDVEEEEGESDEGSKTISRERKMTEKSKAYWKDVYKKDFWSLVRKVEAIQSDVRLAMMPITKDSDISVVRSYHAQWLMAYEQLFEKQDQYVSLLDPDEIIQFGSEWTAIVDNANRFKVEVESWVAEATIRQQQQLPKPQATRSHLGSQRRSQGSVRSMKTGASRTSALSAAKLAEKQKKAELEAQSAALQKKHDLKMAQLKLLMQEEELDLDTKIAMVKAREKIIDEELAAEDLPASITHHEHDELKEPPSLLTPRDMPERTNHLDQAIAAKQSTSDALM